MSITATVINDTIKLPEGTHLEDGTLVEVMPKKASAFLERFKDIIGTGGSVCSSYGSVRVGGRVCSSYGSVHV